MESGPLKIGIIGGGGWGTAITFPLHMNGHSVKIWVFEEEVANEINLKHTNETYLPGITVPDKVTAINDLEMLRDCDVFVIAVPTQFIRPTLSEHKDLFEGKLVVNLAKGIEIGTLQRVSEILSEAIGLDEERYVILTGPSHAEEVARKLPTTVTAASLNPDFSIKVQDIFATPNFRVYRSDDVIGCEIGGSLKNVIAIAAGIIDGLELGDNTKAALITRGLAEISRLGVALNANPMTFSGLSGLGDLIVTCNSLHSRNRNTGEMIGRGIPPEEISRKSKKIAEGVFTTRSAYNMAKRHGVEMPIVEQMYHILFEGKKPPEAIKDLMTRQSKREWWW